MVCGCNYLKILQETNYCIDFFHFSNFHIKLQFYYTSFTFFENYIELTNWCVTNYKKYLNIYLCYLIEVTLITFNATLIYNIFVIKFIISLVVFLNIWLTHCNGFFFQVLQHVLKGLFPISLSLQISFYDLSFFFFSLVLLLYACVIYVSLCRYGPEA